MSPGEWAPQGEHLASPAAQALLGKHSLEIAKPPRGELLGDYLVFRLCLHPPKDRR
jgi:hypothetical protein